MLGIENLIDRPPHFITNRFVLCLEIKQWDFVHLKLVRSYLAVQTEKIRDLGTKSILPAATDTPNLAAVFNRLLCGGEYAYHAQACLAIGQWWPTGAN